MKHFMIKFGSLFAVLAMVVTTATVNSTCACIMHQEELPETAKKLRKF